MNVDKVSLVQSLRSVADVLRPFTDEIGVNSLVWNGSAYVKAEPREGDPHALAWWLSLTLLADYVECQDTPPNDDQVSYLKKTLLGGMGSLNDFGLDSRQFGEAALKANSELYEKLNETYQLLEALNRQRKNQ